MTELDPDEVYTVAAVIPIMSRVWLEHAREVKDALDEAEDRINERLAAIFAEPEA